MEHYPQISDTRTRFKHQMLVWRVYNPIAYKAIVSLLIMLLIGSAAFGYFKFFKQAPAKTYAEQFDLKIDTFSSNGQISDIKGNTVTIKTGVVKTQGEEAILTYQTVKLDILPQTIVVKTTFEDGKAVSTPASISDLQVGNNIAFYSSENPNASTAVNVEKIEIINL